VAILLVVLAAATVGCAATGGAGSPSQGAEVSGERLFQSLGCAECHEDGAGVAAPTLEGIYGGMVTLEGGETVTVDDDYLRRSILTPQADVVAGYRPIMPEFGDRLDEGELAALIDYLRTLGD
jgi:cytochrome c oxidase subunit 2